MARTPSNMLPLGSKAALFTLPDTVSGQKLSLESLQGAKGTVIVFICNHCPFVKHINPTLVALALEFIPKGIAFIAISSNDVERYPEDGPDLMHQTALREGYPFPYLYDEDQSTAKTYDAACTPDFFLFDKELALVYRGQLDDSRPENGIPVSGKDLRAAMEATIDGRPVPPKQKPSIGCNIKWKEA